MIGAPGDLARERLGKARFAARVAVGNHRLARAARDRGGGKRGGKETGHGTISAKRYAPVTHDAPFRR